MQSSIRIKQRVTRFVSWSQIALIFLASISVAFWLGTKSTGIPFLNKTTFASVTDKDEKIRLLERLNNRLENEIAVTERSTKVKIVAAEKMKIMLREKNSELLKLTQELKFYRTLYVPGSDNTAIQVKVFKLRKDRGADQFIYNLVLTGVPKKQEKVSGVIGLAVEGEQQGTPKELVFKDISEANDDTSLRFSFKYFQKISGSFLLPESFKPRSVHIKVLRDGSKKEPVTVSYDWDEAYKETEFHSGSSEESL